MYVCTRHKHTSAHTPKKYHPSLSLSLTPPPPLLGVFVADALAVDMGVLMEETRALDMGVLMEDALPLSLAGVKF